MESCEQTRWVEGRNGEEEAENNLRDRGTSGSVEKKIKEFGPIDIIIVNPLSAYAEEGVLSQRANRTCFTGWLILSWRSTNAG